DQVLAPVDGAEDLDLERTGIGRPRDRPTPGAVERRPHELGPQPSRLVEEARGRPPRADPRPHSRVERAHEEAQAIAGRAPMAAHEALGKLMPDLPALELLEETGRDPPGHLERRRRRNGDRDLLPGRPRDEAVLVVDLR